MLLISRLFGQRATLAFIPGAWQKKQFSNLVEPSTSAALVQVLTVNGSYIQSCASVKKKTIQTLSLLEYGHMTLTGQEARKRGEVFGEESSAAAQGM